VRPCDTLPRRFVRAKSLGDQALRFLEIRVLLANLSGFSADLDRGCIAVFEDTRIRVRPLSITG